MNQKPLIVAIIQARMGSTRLPGKVLKKILGEPMLWHIVNRVKKSRYIDTVIIAATEDKKDVAIEDFANEYHLGICRGSENDIVDRYYNAARKYDAGVVVRIWGDCPLIDPEIIDKTIEQFLSYNADYANNFNPPTFPFGMNIEIYSLNALEQIWKEIKDPFFRDYPFEYMYVNQKSFKTAYVKNDVDLSDIHWTVDYSEDFELITKIYEKLYKENEVFHMADVLDAIERDPKLKEKNQGLERNIEYNKERSKRSESEWI